MDLLLSSGNRFDAGDFLLQTFTVGGLAAGQSVGGNLTVALPAMPPPGFTQPETVFLGLLLDPDDAVMESNKTNNSSSPEQGNDWAPLPILTALQADGTNHAFASADAVPLNSRVTGAVGAGGGANFYEITSRRQVSSPLRSMPTALPRACPCTTRRGTC